MNMIPTAKELKLGVGNSGSLVVLIATIILFSSSLSAQGPPGGSTGPLTSRTLSQPMIGGRILDQLTKAQLANVMVYLENRGGAVMNSMPTDSRGKFRFLGLGADSYVIRFEVEGFKPFRRTYNIIPGSRGFSNEIIFLERLEGAPPPPSLANLVTDPNVPSKARKAYQKGMKELLDKKRPERALIQFEKALELYSEFQLAYVQLAAAHIELEQFEPARDALVKAVALDPDHAKAHVLLGGVYQALGDIDGMVGSLQETVRLNPGNVGAHALLATTFLSAGDPAAAETHARAAHDLNKDDPALHLLLFNVAASINDMETAEFELREFLELFPDHGAAPDIRQRLEQIEQLKASQGQ